ncbi:hypothetical protein PVMG_06285 [Plasmodium vivax Mauritania I]|uniref:Uncharacterized protein n=1 Tax=Plasmodium vivax Mauritania I TaxID=1035515 RepID=A0A0J9W466_PLAVI|nr:hypothetical protein PVMG_06285 [Plasmodium vivax Mauritania I]
MSENELDKSLLNYEKYFVLKGKFEKTENKKDELNLDEFLDNEKYYNSKKDAFRDVLKELLKHLRNYGVLLSHRDEACSYISYILSKEVKAKGYTYDKEIFEMFQRFVEKYNNRTGYKSSYCSNTLVHVNFEIYNKMEKLYALYEKFNKFLEDYALWKEDVLHCSALHSFLNQYKDFIRNYQPTKIKYNNILDHFRNEIKKQCLKHVPQNLKDLMMLNQDPYLVYLLDPSLEEEEDDSVKFPVVSMDHFKEDFQIFMNMKVGILDIVQ